MPKERKAKSVLDIWHQEEFEHETREQVHSVDSQPPPEKEDPSPGEESQSVPERDG